MTKIDQCIIEYCIDIYGANITELTINDYPYLKIKVNEDIFKVNLSDKERFGQYTFFHKNKTKKGYSHVQVKAKDLGFGVYCCCTHFQKYLNVRYNREDWRKFKEDAIKFKLNNNKE